MKFYRVAVDDSMLKLAFRFDISVQLIKSLNSLISDDLYPGQILRILDKGTSNSNMLFESEEEIK